MKKLAISKSDPCKACLSCVRACSEAFYKTFDPDLSCIRIVAKPDGEPKVQYCIMCGKCARTCPEGAITQNAKGVFMIDKRKCVGCGECVKACPMQVMSMPAVEGARPSKCIACGICAKACPMGILSIEEK
jgi:Fe-S-cluster-containing hydrogenase component 2